MVHVCMACGFSRLALVFLLVIAALLTWPAAEAVGQTTSIMIELDEQNSSGLSGTATLTAVSDQTNVEIELDGVDGDNPARIHVGTCDDLEPIPAYELDNIDAAGLSVSTVDVSLDELLASPFAINVALAPDELGTYIACGEIEEPLNEVFEPDDDAVAAAANVATLPMVSYNGTGVTGTATLTALNGETRIVIEVTGSAVASGDDVTFYNGLCDSQSEAESVALTPLGGNGVSITTLEFPLTNLRATDFSIAVSRPDSDPLLFVTCGDTEGVDLGLGGGTVPTVPPPAATGANAPLVPAVGVGTTWEDGGHGLLMAGLGLLAAALGVGGAARRRRESRIVRIPA